ncbi:MAG: Nicotinate-nucleotide adenylyltransferase [Verrucomicrobiota bacterium]
MLLSMKTTSATALESASAGTSPMRVGLFGGSFDPVHLGHLLVARAALEELSLDHLIFLPAARSPFKPGSAPAPAEWRLRMLRLALAGETRVSVDDRELRRGGISYSLDTVREFIGESSVGTQFFWLIGADHVPTLPAWREAEVLARLVEFVVIPRPGAPSTTLPPPFRLRILQGWPLGLASSGIRDRVRGGLPIQHLVPPAVAEVVAAEGLYRGPE